MQKLMEELCITEMRTQIDLHNYNLYSDFEDPHKCALGYRIGRHFTVRAWVGPKSARHHNSSKEN